MHRRERVQSWELNLFVRLHFIQLHFLLRDIATIANLPFTWLHPSEDVMEGGSIHFKIASSHSFVALCLQYSALYTQKASTSQRWQLTATSSIQMTHPRSVFKLAQNKCAIRDSCFVILHNFKPQGPSRAWSFRGMELWSKHTVCVKAFFLYLWKRWKA